MWAFALLQRTQATTELSALRTPPRHFGWGQIIDERVAAETGAADR